MRTLLILVSVLSLAMSRAPGGALMVSNSKGFNSTPLLDAEGLAVTGFDPVIVAVGTFASAPSAPVPPAGLALGGGQWAALLAEFTRFGPETSLVEPVAPLNLLGVFHFQHDEPVAGTPLEGKPVYVIVAKGATLATAEAVCILRTAAIFDAAEDENALPKRVPVGIAHGTTVIAGSSSIHMASATNLDPSPGPAYTLAAITTAPEIAVEQPEGNPLENGTAVVDFGFVTVGLSADLTFTLRNSGGGDLHLTGTPAVVIGGADAARFSVVEAPASVVAPGGHATFTVRFTPVPGAPAAASLSIPNDDPDGHPFVIQLTGNGAWAEIEVESPEGTGLVDGVSTLGFGPAKIGGRASGKTVTVRNIGAVTLTGLQVSIDNAGFAYDATSLPVDLPPGASGSFEAHFLPAGTASGGRSATLHIASSDWDENPFDILLEGTALSPVADADGDGMSDWAEHRLSVLGFDWQLSQPTLVDALYENVNDAGLYTQAQMQALHLGTPLIARDPGTGNFKLTLDWKKATDLTNFLDFPAAPSDVSVNGAGDIEFEFASPDDAAFFRLEVE